MTPGPWEAALLALAAYRLWRLLAQDDILERPRDRLLATRPRLDSFVACPACSGFWITVVVWAVWLVWPAAALTAATPLALSAAVVAAERIMR